MINRSETVCGNFPKYFDVAVLDLEIVLPEEARGMKHVYHQYVIRVNDRNRLRDYLSACEIEAAIHYPVPVHLQPAYIKTRHGDLSLTEEICKEILSLPMHPSMNEDDARIISSEIREFYPE